MRAVAAWVGAFGGVLGMGAGAALGQPVDGATRELGRKVADRAIAYLRGQQDEESGGWRHSRDDRPNFPAITGLVVTGLVMDPRIDAGDEDVAAGVRYMLSFQKEDGGIYDTALPSYNTAICLSALARVGTPEAARAVGVGRSFLIGLQYHEGNSGSAESPDFTEPVPFDHPYYGGVGYGRSGRPDLSNTGFFVQALHDTGLSTEDEAFKRALVFLSRVQMLDSVNDFGYADGSEQGGFIYATVPDRDSVEGRAGQSFAGEVQETLSDGSVGSRLRAYGSMTYVGFKSLVYADLASDDERVVAARRWLEEHFTVEENPGLGAEGQYYYYCAMGRALSAWGEARVGGQDWRAALIGKLAELQAEDGSFRVLHDRWMEADPVLITAYGLIAVQEALGGGQ